MDVTGNTHAHGMPPAVVASIRDVARAAGVSHMTVSRVLNGHPHVSERTRGVVQDAIERLEFRPSQTARALAVGAADHVTVMTSETNLYGYSATLRGVEEAARAAEVGISIYVLESDAADVVSAAVARAADPREGAVVVLAYNSAGAAVLQALEALPVRVRTAAAVESILGRRRTTPTWAWFDDATAARRATEHLLELGHRTVHHVAIPSSTTRGDRERGWRHALQAAGAPVPAVVQPRSWTTAAAHRSALELLTAPGVTAVLCGNDDQALGVLRAARDLGIAVPEQLSVVGFDDVPGAEFYSPSLSTVRFDFVALGRRTFELLGIGRRSAGSTEVLVPEPELIVRESSGPPTS